ncbi:MAG: manganese efflux pump [Elusimicrobiaceae bacterium]|nr:manganese efflux pump [Elusimicrobiaceae bacterium]
MSMLSVIIIFVCICVDNMVSANMSAVKMTKENKSVFSVKLALVFTIFNVLLFGLGYIISILFHGWSYFAHNWVVFAFLLLLGIKFMLEYIEKSPSFGDADAGDNWKLAKVSALIGMNSFLVGYALETVGRAFFPDVMLLLIITFVLSLLGAHLGGADSKNLLSKKLELIAGIVLIVMSIIQIVY